MKNRILVFVSILTSVTSFAQPNAEEFNTFLQSCYEKFDLPAMSVSVVKDGRVVLNSNFGEKSEKSKTGVPNENTLYAIASLSKAFTSAAIGMLVDEGKLKWDDKVVEHLPWFALNDPYVTANITIEDLLCHRSGLITFDGDLLWYGSNYTREEAIKRLRERPLTYGFRSEFGYQNLMFMTAGEVIESASGMTWDEFIETRILKPIGMVRTTSSFQKFSTDFNSAKPHLKGKEIFMLSYDNSGATAALNSSTADMSKWIDFWLDNGIVNGDTLLSAQSIKKLWSTHTPLGVGNFDERNGTHFKGYGMGWFLMDYDGKKVIHHGGGLPGYISKVAIIPEDNLGIIALTNDMSSVPSLLMYAVIDWANGKDYTKWMDMFYEFKVGGDQRESDNMQERLETKKADPRMLPVTDYLGIYEDVMYGKAEVSMGESGLIMSLLPAKELFTGNMEPWNDHAFKFEVNDPFLPFGAANFDVKEDVIKGFTIELPNNDFHFNKLYFKKQ